MKPNQISQLKIQAISKGFTLIEILVALVVAAIASTLFVSLIRVYLAANETNETRSTNQLNLNLALDLIADEIRSGNQLNLAAPACPPTLAGEPLCTQAVLSIQDDMSMEIVAYYLADAISGEHEGDRVIQRWGNAFDATGNATGTARNDTLLDGLGSTMPVTSTDCQDTSLTPRGDSSFYICVSGNQTAEIHIQTPDGTAVSTTVSTRL
ncbi:type II secretion system protein J [Synechococcus sp. PCC 7336]|uniref:PulJ/GspJ family protein n=1 Tax=Synechococcus sp. PCC 7336 TaxID=195250 RepID=UPI0008FBDE82|nr:type II secretion system protein [Synechococcus sp. PCC 7336]